MKKRAETIALVIDPVPPTEVEDRIDNTGAHRLLREPDGSVRLEPVETQEEFDRIARDTGCFRRGRAIRDPKTFEVIGYEMEEISPRLTLVTS
jgi:hypothetical protein